MKKIGLGLLLAVQLSSCASVAQDGIPLSKYQIKPVDGSHRKLSGWFYVDLLFPPSLIVDFWTQKIYREYPKGFYPNDIRTSKTN